jgi:hypothetical protein
LIKHIPGTNIAPTIAPIKAYVAVQMEDHESQFSITRDNNPAKPIIMPGISANGPVSDHNTPGLSQNMEATIHMRNHHMAWFNLFFNAE